MHDTHTSGGAPSIEANAPHTGETKDVPLRDPFPALFDELRALRTLWYEEGLEVAEAAHRLQPVSVLVRTLMADYERDRLSLKQVRDIDEQQKRLLTLATNLQVDMEQYFPEGFDVMNAEEVLEVLKAAQASLYDLLEVRKTAITELLMTRHSLLVEVGDANAPVVAAGRHGGEVLFRPDGYYMLQDRFHPPSASSIRRLEDDIVHLTDLRESRKSNVARICKEISEHLVNENIARHPIDTKVLDYMRTKDYRRIGISSDRIHQLVQRNEYLIKEEKQLELFMEDVKKKLKLIEDRQALLNVILNVESAAGAPQRLFGDSTKLVKETEFRRNAYIRLLGLERVIHKALVDWHRSHGARFMYKGVDYLEAMEEDLKTRVVPHVFPRPDDMESRTTDFTYVVQQACTALPSADLDDMAWTRNEVSDVSESLLQRDKRILLKNGWLPPESEESIIMSGMHAERRKRLKENRDAPFEEETRKTAKFQPPEIPLRRRECDAEHVDGAPCQFPVLDDILGTGTTHLPPKAPCVFKTDPHLLLPTPPRVRAQHVRLRQHHIQRMRSAKHNCECKLDHAVLLKEERAADKVVYKPVVRAGSARQKFGHKGKIMFGSFNH